MFRHTALFVTTALLLTTSPALAETNRDKSKRAAEQASQRSWHGLPDIFDGMRAERRAKRWGMGHDIVVTQRTKRGTVKRIYAEKKGGLEHYKTEIRSQEPNAVLEREIYRDRSIQHIRRGRRIYTFEHKRRDDGTFTPRVLKLLRVEKRGGLTTRHYDFEQGLVTSQSQTGRLLARPRVMPAMKNLKLRLRNLTRQPIKR